MSTSHALALISLALFLAATAGLVVGPRVLTGPAAILGAVACGLTFALGALLFGVAVFHGALALD